MTSRSRRQTRSRRFGPSVWPPYEHNAAVAQRKAFRRLQKRTFKVTRAFHQLSKAAEAAQPAIQAFADGFTVAWAIREQTELERTRSHAQLLGMDDVDADRMIEDFRLTRGDSASAGGNREWADLRDEITDHCLGFGTARLIG